MCGLPIPGVSVVPRRLAVSPPVTSPAQTKEASPMNHADGTAPIYAELIRERGMFRVTSARSPRRFCVT